MVKKEFKQRRVTDHDGRKTELKVAELEQWSSASTRKETAAECNEYVTFIQTLTITVHTTNINSDKTGKLLTLTLNSSF